jgi:hypothetical protein
MEPNMERRGQNLPLDDRTAERLVAGAVAPGDAPPGYAPVARLLADARSHLPVTALDDELLGELVLAVQVQPAASGRLPLSKRVTARVGAVAAVALLSTAGVAAAATGNLPGPAQDAVAGVVDRIGIDLPTDTADELDPVDTADSGDVADGEGTGTEGDADGTETETDADDGTGIEAKPATGHADNPTDADAHGAAVSEVARTTEATGRAKGAEVSETARAGHGPDATTDTTVAGEDDADDGDDADSGRPADAGAQPPVDVSGGAVAGQAGQGAGKAASHRP